MGENNLNSPEKSVDLTEDKVIEGELIKSNECIPMLEKNNTMLLPPPHHTYPVFIIQLAVQQVIYAGLKNIPENNHKFNSLGGG